MSKRPRVVLSLVAIAIFLGAALDRWVFASPDFDQVYRLVLARVVSTRDEELTAVALARLDDDQPFAPLPHRLHQKLLRDWLRNGVKTDLIISPDRIVPTYGEIEREGFKMKAFEMYVDSKTKKPVRVIVIDSIRWLGSDEVLVSWSAVHASLDGGGSTLRLKRTLGFWHVMEETQRWIS
jgi:hypothetical protein